MMNKGRRKIHCCSKKYSMVLCCIAALCCFFAAQPEGLSSDGALIYVCDYSPKALERIGLFGGRGYAGSHLAIKCAAGAVAGSSIGAKFGGVLGAASGAAAGCYLFANAASLDGLLYKLDRYIGLTPTPLDNCNQHCAERETDGKGPGELCKEIEVNDTKPGGAK